MAYKQASKNKHDYQKTAAFKERMRIGAAIADRLPKTMGANECAAKLGISPQMLRRTECEMFHKLYVRMVEARKDITLQLDNGTESES